MPSANTLHSRRLVSTIDLHRLRHNPHIESKNTLASEIPGRNRMIHLSSDNFSFEGFGFH